MRVILSFLTHSIYPDIIFSTNTEIHSVASIYLSSCRYRERGGGGGGGFMKDGRGRGS